MEEQKRPPLPVRVLGVVVMLVLAGMLVMWGIDLGKRIIGAGSGETDPAAQAALGLQDELAKVNAERERLDAAGAAATAALKEAQGRIQALQADNSQLAGDLELTESQLPPEKAGAGPAIRGLRANMVSPTQLQYGLLLAYGAKKARPVLNGQLQFAVTLVQDGKKRVAEFPPEKDADGPQYVVKVQSRQRLDGMLELPPGARADSLQVSLLDKGQVVARLSTTVKDISHVSP
jgi:ABC-type transporter Mla subunit MlaD